jgi:hypothetical protein
MDLLQGKTKWQPTWTKLPWDTKVMRGFVDQPVHEKELPLRLGGAKWKQKKALPPGVFPEASLAAQEKVTVEARR